METARVDIRKLQLLNDRIGQCLDALAQVRLSVHGLSHAGLPTPAIGAATPYGQSAAVGMAATQDPRFIQSQIPYAQQVSPFYQQPFAQYVTGLSHTPFNQPFTGWQPSPSWPQQVAQFAPQQQTPFNPAVQANGAMLQAWGMQSPFAGIQGLSHSAAETDPVSGQPLWADPILAARVRETFPYAGYAVPPLVSLI